MNSRMRNEGKMESRQGRQGNRLIGWLVSFGIADTGVAYEIRQGRTFISGGSDGEARTIALVDESVSAPHLAMNASPKHKVLVQDIFSDEGSFLCKSNSAEEMRITGPVYVEHGDWLRVGSNTRFQVCLIDGPSR